MLPRQVFAGWRAPSALLPRPSPPLRSFLSLHYCIPGAPRPPVWRVGAAWCSLVLHPCVTRPSGEWRGLSWLCVSSFCGANGVVACPESGLLGSPCHGSRVFCKAQVVHAPRIPEMVEQWDESLVVALASLTGISLLVVHLDPSAPDLCGGGAWAEIRA